jgi:cell division protein FtsB
MRAMPKRVVLAAVAAFAFGIGLLLHTLFWSDSWKNRQRVRADLEALERLNAAQEIRMRELRAEIEALRTRPEVQERVVRHELGYTRPGDLVLELEASAP